ncbi:MULTISPECIES: DMT family transporter [unclassified Methylobacterium]|uniref:DMT family transporter n=1 Tax=unclassified Methylobacterium TaxID=2615210 RepID=UPI0009EA2AE3|nr:MULTISPECIES: DMT family transporter [unclassified Methylobacterium]MCK2053635.1 DMT family transporter [Methylobacterium sp. 37f]
MPPPLARSPRAPWWAWLGGCLSVLLILAQLYASPAIGPRPSGESSCPGIIVTVGVVPSIGLDQFGWVGLPVHPASLWRVAGAGFMILGVALVALF